MNISPRPDTHPHIVLNHEDVLHHDVRKCGTCVLTMKNGDQYTAVQPDAIEHIKSLTPVKPRV